MIDPRSESMCPRYRPYNCLATLVHQHTDQSDTIHTPSQRQSMRMFQRRMRCMPSPTTLPRNGHWRMTNTRTLRRRTNKNRQNTANTGYCQRPMKLLQQRMTHMSSRLRSPTIDQERTIHTCRSSPPPLSCQTIPMDTRHMLTIHCEPHTFPQHMRRTRPRSSLQARNSPCPADTAYSRRHPCDWQTCRPDKSRTPGRSPP